MEQGDLLFVIWWYGVAAVLAVGTSESLRERSLASFDEVMRVLLVGIAAGLALYLAPSGITSIQSPTEFKVRFLAALAIAWLLTMQIAARRGEQTDSCGLALAAFVGVNAPALALVASATMVCGGGPTCL